MLVCLPCRYFDKLEAIFTGIIQHVAHHLDKIVLLTDKADLWRNIERDIDPFALIHFVQRRGEIVQQWGDRMQLAAKQCPAAHTGTMQVVANLL